MKYYLYNVPEYSLAGRKRYSKEYLREGEIVAYSRTIERQSSWYDSEPYTEIGLIEIEAYESFPSDMKVYQATEYEIAWVKGEKLKKEYSLAVQDTGVDILHYLIDRIGQYKLGQIAFREQLFSLPFLISAEYSKKFKNDVWDACKDKIGAVGLNFDREKTEVYTILVAEAMIIGTDKTQDECVELSSLLYRHWYDFSIIYSLFYGRNISTGHQRFIELLSFLLGKKDSGKFMKLMLIALGEPQQKIAKIMRYSPLENYQKLYDKIVLMQRQKDLVAQSQELDELFQILFPSTFRQHLENDNPIASIEEMQAQIRESQVTKEILHKVEEYAETLKSELDDAIKMQSLRDAFGKCDPATARAIFAQLDMVLEGNNAVWDKNRLHLKRELNFRYENQQRMIEGTHEQVQLAADYSKKAATQPKLITNHFAEGSVRFEAGSTMNGDVTTH